MCLTVITVTAFQWRMGLVCVCLLKNVCVLGSLVPGDAE